MPSNRDAVLFLYGTTFVILLSAVCALPPDFFRNGRAKPRIVPDKRNSLGDEKEIVSIVTAACEYCQSHTRIPQLLTDCKTNPNIRKVCLAGYLSSVELVLDDLNDTWE